MYYKYSIRGDVQTSFQIYFFLSHHILIYRTGKAVIRKMGKERNIMYKKAISLLLTGNLILLMGFVCVRELAAAGLTAEPAQAMRLELEELESRAQELDAEAAGTEESGSRGIGIADVAVSGQRVVSYQLMEQRPHRVLDEEELEVLLRIVEAEAGCEDEDGKLLVANVVLNRVDNDSFPGTVTEVVFQREKGVTQFSPVANGRYYSVEISEETISAVERALAGEDISEGALYFAARKYANKNRMRWFDENLTFLFTHGGHEFFK